jgi:hypothetical protein
MKAPEPDYIYTVIKFYVVYKLVRHSSSDLKNIKDTYTHIEGEIKSFFDS